MAHWLSKIYSQRYKLMARLQLTAVIQKHCQATCTDYWDYEGQTSIKGSLKEGGQITTKQWMEENYVLLRRWQRTNSCCWNSERTSTNEWINNNNDQYLKGNNSIRILQQSMQPHSSIFFCDVFGITFIHVELEILQSDNWL